jgi:hypothetical protein
MSDTWIWMGWFLLKQIKCSTKPDGNTVYTVFNSNHQFMYNDQIVNYLVTPIPASTTKFPCIIFIFLYKLFRLPVQQFK